ncbi:MAG TPA: hypothetical protein VGI47_10670 [Candidatus Binataceae bacterium]
MNACRSPRRALLNAAVALIVIGLGVGPSHTEGQSETPSSAPNSAQGKPAYETDGSLIVRGLLTVHGPVFVANFIGVKFGTETIHGKLTEDSKKAPAPGTGHAKTIDGPLTVDGTLVVHGSLIVDGLVVYGPVTTGDGYQTL